MAGAVLLPQLGGWEGWIGNVEDLGVLGEHLDWRGWVPASPRGEEGPQLCPAKHRGLVLGGSNTHKAVGFATPHPVRRCFPVGLVAGNLIQDLAV